jgi:hypothetical protein
MKLRNIVLTLVVVIAVIVVGGIYYLSTNLDPLVKNAIEKYGAQSLGVPVTVSGVSIAPGSGEGTIRGLRVANPPGFSDQAVFELDQITVRVDITSVTGNPVLIEEIRIVGPRVNVEANSGGGINMDVIRRNAQKGASAEPSPPAPADTPSSADEASALRLRIARFIFEQGVVVGDLSQTGGKQYQADLPELRLSNLGGDAGATPSQISQEITSAVTSAVSKVIAQQGVSELIDRNLKGKDAEAAKGLLKGILNKSGK